MKYNRNNIPIGHMARFDRKVLFVEATRIDGPFTVETREGPLDCPDGYLAVDVNGDPYPIARDVFEKIYDLNSFRPIVR